MKNKTMLISVIQLNEHSDVMARFIEVEVESALKKGEFRKSGVEYPVSSISLDQPHRGIELTSFISTSSGKVAIYPPELTYASTKKLEVFDLSKKLNFMRKVERGVQDILSSYGSPSMAQRYIAYFQKARCKEVLCITEELGKMHYRMDDPSLALEMANLFENAQKAKAQEQGIPYGVICL